MKIVVRNHTRYPGHVLRSLAVRAARMVNECHGNTYGRLTGKRLIMNVVYSARLDQHQSSGCAYINGNTSKVRVPRRQADPKIVAHVMAHEFGHNAGQRHPEMDGKPWHTWKHKNQCGAFEWAKDFLLVEAQEPEKVRLVGVGLAEKRLTQAQANLGRWQSKAKRAANAIRKFKRRVAYYERRKAACAAE